MPCTRASIRLATQKAVALNEHRVSDTRKAPPRKARRTRPKSRKRKSRRERIKNLDGFVDIPMDIFTQIVSYLFPKDIISLSRSNKSLRNLLMRRSSRHIWTSAMKNVEGLPPCPSDMTEPSYLALLFARDCMGCGRLIGGRLYGELRVRLCVSCRNVRLIRLDCLPGGFDLLLPNSVVAPKASGISWPCYHRPQPTYYASKEEAKEIQEKFDRLGTAGDQIALKEWIIQRTEITHARGMEANAIQNFLYAWKFRSRAAR